MRLTTTSGGKLLLSQFAPPVAKSHQAGNVPISLKVHARAISLFSSTWMSTSRSAGRSSGPIFSLANLSEASRVPSGVWAKRGVNFYPI